MVFRYKFYILLSEEHDGPRSKIEKEESPDLCKENAALAKVNELLKKEKKVIESSSLSLLANQYR